MKTRAVGARLNFPLQGSLPLMKDGHIYNEIRLKIREAEVLPKAIES